jgi:hypothetical protein
MSVDELLIILKKKTTITMSQELSNALIVNLQRYSDISFTPPYNNVELFMNTLANINPDLPYASPDVIARKQFELALTTDAVKNSEHSVLILTKRGFFICSNIQTKANGTNELIKCVIEGHDRDNTNIEYDFEEAIKEESATVILTQIGGNSYIVTVSGISSTLPYNYQDPDHFTYMQRIFLVTLIQHVNSVEDVKTFSSWRPICILSMLSKEKKFLQFTDRSSFPFIGNNPDVPKNTYDIFSWDKTALHVMAMPLSKKYTGNIVVVGYYPQFRAETVSAAGKKFNTSGRKYIYCWPKTLITEVKDNEEPMITNSIDILKASEDNIYNIFARRWIQGNTEATWSNSITVPKDYQRTEINALFKCVPVNHTNFMVFGEKQTNLHLNRVKTSSASYFIDTVTGKKRDGPFFDEFIHSVVGSLRLRNGNILAAIVHMEGFNQEVSIMRLPLNNEVPANMPQWETITKFNPSKVFHVVHNTTRALTSFTTQRLYLEDNLHMTEIKSNVIAIVGRARRDQSHDDTVIYTTFFDMEKRDWKKNAHNEQHAEFYELRVTDVPEKQRIIGVAFI